MLEFLESLKRRNWKMIKVFRLLLVALLVFLTLTFFLSVVKQVQAEETQIPSQLVEADTAVKEAFSAVSKAEDAGANITSLLSRLNDGETLLAQAEMAYRVGDVTNAIDNAADAYAIASEVEDSAISARFTATVNAQNAFWSTTAILTVAGAAFVLFMFFVWIRFKKSYIERLRNSKPEVVRK